MEQINTWGGGLDTDSSFLKIANSKYISLKGGIVVTNSGQSTGAVETERGTQKMFEIPVVPKIFKLEFNKELNVTFPTTITVFLNGDLSTILLAGIDSMKDIYDLLLNNIYVSALVLSGDLKVDYSLEYNNLTIWANEAASGLSVITDAPFLAIKEIDYVKNPVIIGSGMYQDDLILVTCSITNTFSNGQIWKIPLDPKTGLVNSVNGPTGGLLIPFDHLLYTESLNLDSEFYITKIICNPETNAVGRVYWNDRKNPISSLNILVDFPMNTPLELVAGGGQAFFGEIIPRQIIDGGFISAGSVVQYFYRLRSSSGGTASTISLGSNMIPLTGYNSSSSDDNATYEGSPPQASENTELEDTFKSIELELTNLDSNYQFVELIYAFYGNLGSPEFYKVAELPIPQNGTITYIHDGNPANFIDIAPAEINGRVTNITKANDICVKDNRLLAFGVETAVAELEFDTRIYRFNDNQISKLVDDDLGNEVLNGLTLDWDSIPITHNAFNPYNDESDESEWFQYNQYKYQANGSTLGAEGKNIKMQFTTLKLIGEENWENNRTAPPYMYSGRYPDGTILDFGNDVQYDLSNEFKDFRSPKITSFAKGYAREEIYRVFFNAVDKQGNPFYATWCADIKMPHEWDVASYITEGEGFFNSQVDIKFIVGRDRADKSVEIYSLGMEFEVKNLDTIADKISGFFFSVVKRTDENKTKLAHGLVTPMWEIEEGGTETEINYVEAPRNSSRLHAIGENSNVLSGHNAASTLKDGTFIGGTVPYRISSFRSIDDFIKDKAFKYLSTDYFCPSGVYKAINEQSLETTANLPGVYARKIIASSLQGTHFSNSRLSLTDSIWRDLNDNITFNDLNGLENSSTPGGISEGEIYIMSNDYNAFNQLYLPDDTGVLTLMEGMYRFTRSRILYHADQKLVYNPNDPITGEVDLSPDSQSLYMVGAYKRTLTNQYGGNTYEARQNNIAHPVTPFIKLGKNITQKTVKVFGGDTCVSYYPFWTCTRDVLKEDTTIGLNYRSANFITYAITESEVNPFYANGIQWFLDEKTSSQFYQSSSEANDRTPLQYKPETFMEYNKVYLQTNDSKISVPKPSLTRDANEFPSGIFISDLKINGDRIDSWQNFKLDNYKEVDNIYGSINFADNFNDRVIFMQDRALGVQAINERALSFNDDTGTQIVLGNGDLLGDHGYISTRSGTLHNASVIQTEFGLYYFDALQNKIKKFDFESNKPLSDMYGLFSWLENNVAPLGLQTLDNPINNLGVTGGVNLRTNRVYFSFLGEQQYSVCLNEAMQAGEYFPYVNPNLYITTHTSLIAQDPNSIKNYSLLNKGNFNQYFGESKPLSIKFLVNSEPALQKILTNLLWKSESYKDDGKNTENPLESINTVRVYNNYQDTGYRGFPAIKRVLRQWGTKVWFNQLSERKIDRMRNEWHIVELTYSNPNAYRFILHDVISKMQASHSGLGAY